VTAHRKNNLFVIAKFFINTASGLAPTSIFANVGIHQRVPSKSHFIQTMLTVAVSFAHRWWALQLNLRIPAPFQALIVMFIDQPNRQLHAMFVWRGPFGRIQRIHLHG
jgi:hypothetical protein